MIQQGTIIQRFCFSEMQMTDIYLHKLQEKNQHTFESEQHYEVAVLRKFHSSRMRITRETVI